MLQHSEAQPQPVESGLIGRSESVAEDPFLPQSHISRGTVFLDLRLNDPPGGSAPTFSPHGTDCAGRNDRMGQIFNPQPGRTGTMPRFAQK